MIACIAIGAYYKKEYISVCGVAFFFVALTAMSIINKVRGMQEINHELKMNAQKTGEGPENVGELVQSCFGFTKENKEKLKNSSFGDKFKVIALLVSLGVFLLIMFIGVVFANAGTLSDGTITNIAKTGFILMGIGGGGFVLEILVLLIISKIIGR